MPSARQVFLDRGFVGLAQDASPFRRVEMAQDAMPQAWLKGAAGGKANDQDPDQDDTGEVYESAAQATFAKLHKLLAAGLSPEDLDTATQLIQQLFSDTSDNANGGGAMAADRFPNANRLSGRRASDRSGQSYEVRFPDAGRLRTRTYG